MSYNIARFFHFSLEIEFNALHFINYTIPRLCSTYAMATLITLNLLLTQWLPNHYFLTKQKYYISYTSSVFTKDDRMEKNNKRPISILSCLSKILEKIIFQQTGTYFENICPPYLSSLRKRCGCQNVLTQMTERWSNTLDNKKVIGALSSWILLKLLTVFHTIY